MENTEKLFNTHTSDPSLESPSFAPAGQAGMNTRKGGDFYDESSYAVNVSETETASLVVRFEDVVTVRGSTIGKMTAWLVYEDGSRSGVFSDRVSLGAQRDGLQRALKDAFPIKGSWSLLLSAVLSGIMEKLRFYEMSTVKSVAEMVPAQSFHLLEPFLENGVANLVFARGSTGKTTFCVGMGVAVISGTPFLGVAPMLRTKVLFVDYEGSEEAVRDKVCRIGASIKGWKDEYKDDFYYKESNGLPLHEMADDIRRLVEEKGIGLLIVDSALGAIGGAPEDAACTSLYFNALRKIGITSLTVAHVAKNSTDDLTAFGSVFFMNLSRNVWNLQSEEHFVGATKTVVAKHRKYNNGPLCDNITYTMTAVPSSITFVKVEEKKTTKSAKERIRAALDKFGEMTTVALRDVTSLPPNTVRGTLSRMEEDGEVEVLKSGKRRLVVT